MTAPPPNDWLEQGQNAVWFFGVAFAGLCVLLFGRPIQHPPRKQTPKGWRKQPKPKRTIRKSRIVQKPKKAKKEKPQKWYVPPPMTAHEHAEYAKFHAKSRGIKTDDSWGVPD